MQRKRYLERKPSLKGALTSTFEMGRWCNITSAVRESKHKNMFNNSRCGPMKYLINSSLEGQSRLVSCFLGICFVF